MNLVTINAKFVNKEIKTSVLYASKEGYSEKKKSIVNAKKDTMTMDYNWIA